MEIAYISILWMEFSVPRLTFREEQTPVSQNRELLYERTLLLYKNHKMSRG